MLGIFLRQQCATGGEWNCSTMPADWCIKRGHPDFAEEWRSVVDPTDCEAVPREAGGLLALWDRGIGSALPMVTDELRSGDIAVVGFGRQESGAIWTGERWAIRAARCVHFVDIGGIEIAKAWRP